MTADDNKALVRRYKLEILNGRRLDAVSEVASDDYLDHAAFPGQPPGLDGFRYRLEVLVRAFDPYWTILDVVADDDRAVVRWVLDGVHRDRFLGLAATGQRITLQGIDMYRIRGGKLSEHWNVVDLLPLLVADRSRVPRTHSRRPSIRPPSLEVVSEPCRTAATTTAVSVGSMRGEPRARLAARSAASARGPRTTPTASTS